MANNKKPRKAYKPKRKITDLLGFMARIPSEILAEDGVAYELALGAMLHGEGTLRDCNTITGVLNAAAVMCLQHDWPEHYDMAVLGQKAQQTMIDRVKAGKSILYTGPEMEMVKNAIALYRAQMELMTPREIANVAKLVNQTLVARNYTKPL